MENTPSKTEAPSDIHPWAVGGDAQMTEQHRMRASLDAALELIKQKAEADGATPSQPRG